MWMLMISKQTHHRLTIAPEQEYTPGTGLTGIEGLCTCGGKFLMLVQRRFYHESGPGYEHHEEHPPLFKGMVGYFGFPPCPAVQACEREFVKECVR